MTSNDSPVESAGNPVSTSKVLRWIQRSGYPFEMEVAATLATNGWRLQYNSTYTDPDGGRTRELDILASIGDAASFHLAILCRTSRKKPWILIARPLHAVADYSSSTGVVDALSKMCVHAGAQFGLHVPPILQFNGDLAVSAVRAYSRNGTSSAAPVATLRQAGAAAFAIARQMAGYQLLASADNGKGHANGGCRVVVPLVLVDAPIFLYSRESDGNDILRSVNEASVAVQTAGSRNITMMYVVSRDHFSSFIARHTPEIQSYCSALGELAEAIAVEFTTVVREAGGLDHVYRLHR
jgi:hypothetical protein